MLGLTKNALKKKNPARWRGSIDRLGPTTLCRFNCRYSKKPVGPLPCAELIREPVGMRQVLI